MNIAVIGAGAMGCLYGAYLSRGHEVVMLDPKETQVDAINSSGISIEEANGSTRTFDRVRACVSGRCAQTFDLVIIFVKSTATETALKQNARLFSKETFVMTLQNGAGNDKKIEQYVNKEQVIIGTSKHNAVNLGLGRITHPASGVTTIGSNFGAEQATRSIAEALSQSDLEVSVTDDIQRIIWSKLLVNLSVNTFTAITQTPIGYMVKDKNAWNFAKRLIYEAIEVAEADGTYFDRREALQQVKTICQQAGEGYSSMYQDRKRRVPMEIDSINGAIVEQAKQYGVPTPYNSLIVDLIHAIEGAYAFD